MTIFWNIIWIVLGLWVLGALVTALLTWIFVALNQYYFRNRPNCISASFPDFLFAFVVSLFAWPSLVRDRFQEASFYWSVFRGGLPRWMVYEQGESVSRVWKLSDGTEFSGSCSKGKANEITIVNGLYVESVKKKTTNNKPGNVFYRHHMTAPTVTPTLSQWTEMKIEYPQSQEEEEVVHPEDDDGEDFPEGPQFREALRLDRGKYEFEFRVRDEKGNFEELSKLVVIVVGKDEYDPR